MRRFTRLAPPQYLTDNWERWGNRYAQNKHQNPGHAFQWATHEGVRVNQKLLPILTSQTQSHCSYCDHYPPLPSDETIDHFRPKGDVRFYHMAYQWENLYFACADCQKIKMEVFDDLLLNPDAANYDFDRYFIFNYDNYEIQINPRATITEKAQAEITIKLLDLNNNSRCTVRRHAFERYQRLTFQEFDINDFPFRFMFE